MLKLMLLNVKKDIGEILMKKLKTRFSFLLPD